MVTEFAFSLFIVEEQQSSPLSITSAESITCLTQQHCKSCLVRGSFSYNKVLSYLLFWGLGLDRANLFSRVFTYLFRLLLWLFISCCKHSFFHLIYSTDSLYSFLLMRVSISVSVFVSVSVSISPIYLTNLAVKQHKVIILTSHK